MQRCTQIPKSLDLEKELRRAQLDFGQEENLCHYQNKGDRTQKRQMHLLSMAKCRSLWYDTHTTGNLFILLFLGCM